MRTRVSALYREGRPAWGRPWTVFLAAAALALVMAAPSAWAGPASNSRLLVDTEWVVAHGQAPEVRVLDVRPLGEYQQGHIPGALHFDVGLVWTERDGVKGMLPPPDELNAIFGRHGIGRDSTVVVYDAQGGLWASRVWFALDYMGHADVRLLDGGWLAWADEKKPVTRAVPMVEPVTYSGQPDPSKIADAQWVLAHLKDESVKPLDTRSPAEYEGSDVRSARGGHIPGAVNVNWVETVSGPTKTFKDPEELKAVFQAAGVTPDKEVVPYCQTHVRGSHASFVLRLLGYEKVRGYDGSWAEWGNRADLPLEK